MCCPLSSSFLCFFRDDGEQGTAGAVSPLFFRVKERRWGVCFLQALLLNFRVCTLRPVKNTPHPPQTFRTQERQLPSPPPLPAHFSCPYPLLLYRVRGTAHSSGIFRTTIEIRSGIFRRARSRPHLSPTLVYPSSKLATVFNKSEG